MDYKEIQLLLLKYRQGNCTDEEAGQISKWYESLNAASDLSLDDTEKQLLESKLLQNIREKIHEAEPEAPDATETNNFWKPYSIYAGIAAVFLIALTYLLFFSNTGTFHFMATEQIFIQATADGKLITDENDTDTLKRIVLEDKSIVMLSPGSRIIYPDRFTGNKRNVQLIGDAFFEITKNPQSPFFVYTDKLITRVLGTSFWIRKNPGSKAMEVEVVTGKVSVFENNHAFTGKALARNLHKQDNGVVLSPNQRVTYFAESGHLMTGLVEKPVAIPGAIAEPKMIFNNESLPNIIYQLQNEFGIEIVLSSDHLEKCTFTGDVTDLSLYEKLDLICKSNGVTYEIKGTRILINGEGCE
ncbi:FecR family protein [Dyadobacter sp. NIV53]|uniref:FecR family protein n=1 Tax=Dyadobacter sp. NIV53 TaxID=2861765 RepID=UPI001C85F670|nr:FecR family protein [Dyadobacter sp. NIV53]